VDSSPDLVLPVDPGRPGPVYDTALRRLVEGDLPGTCELLGVPVDAPPRVLNGTLPTATLSADLLLQVGPDRLVHVEYMRTATRDLVARMLIYRGLIMRRYPRARLTQHVIVLGDGTVRGHRDREHSGFELDLDLLYLRDLDPAVLLARPSLAPLAVLGRGDVPARAGAFAAALRLIRAQGGDRADELLEFAAVLGTIRLDRPTMERIAKEVPMTAESIAEFWRDGEIGQILIQQGRQEGRQEGRAELLMTLLRASFGDQPDLPEIAQRLAGWPSTEAAVRAITAATRPQDIPQAPATG